MQLELESNQKPFWARSVKAGMLLTTEWNPLPSFTAQFLLHPDLLATLVISTGELEDWHYLKRNATKICQFGEEVSSSECESSCTRCVHAGCGRADLVPSRCGSSLSCLMGAQALNSFISTVAVSRKAASFPIYPLLARSVLSVLGTGIWCVLKPKHCEDHILLLNSD